MKDRIEIETDIIFEQLSPGHIKYSEILKYGEENGLTPEQIKSRTRILVTDGRITRESKGKYFVNKPEAIKDASDLEKKAGTLLRKIENEIQNTDGRFPMGRFLTKNNVTDICHPAVFSNALNKFFVNRNGSPRYPIYQIKDGVVLQYDFVKEISDYIEGTFIETNQKLGLLNQVKSIPSIPAKVQVKPRQRTRPRPVKKYGFIRRLLFVVIPRIFRAIY